MFLTPPPPPLEAGQWVRAETAEPEPTKAAGWAPYGHSGLPGPTHRPPPCRHAGAHSSTPGAQGTQSFATASRRELQRRRLRVSRAQHGLGVTCTPRDGTLKGTHGSGWKPLRFNHFRIFLLLLNLLPKRTRSLKSTNSEHGPPLHAAPCFTLTGSRRQVPR